MRQFNDLPINVQRLHKILNSMGIDNLPNDNGCILYHHKLTSDEIAEMVFKKVSIHGFGVNLEKTNYSHSLTLTENEVSK